MNGGGDVTVRVRPKDGAAVEAAYRLSTSTPGLAFASGMPSEGRDQPAVAPGTESAPGTITIDAARRQEIGVRTAPVQVRGLSTTLRGGGRVAYDETRQSEVTRKISGSVRDLRVGFTRRPVPAGEGLLTASRPQP